MPGTSSKTEQVTVRLPVDLLEWIKTQSGSKAEVIAAALVNLRDGPVIVDIDAAKVAKLEAEVASLTEQRDQWRTRAKAIVEAKAGVPVPRVDAVATKTIGHHPAGPILEPRLKVQGEARPFFRPGTAADKAAKS